MYSSFVDQVQAVEDAACLAYSYAAAKRRFFDAQKECAKQGGKLAEPITRAQFNMVRALCREPCWVKLEEKIYKINKQAEKLNININ